MTLHKTPTEILRTSRYLIHLEELRTLRNLYWMPDRIVAGILDTLFTKHISKYLNSWIAFCRGFNISPQFEYRVLIPHYALGFGDEFEGCYDSDYNLTTLGQELHDDATTLVLNQG